MITMPNAQHQAATAGVAWLAELDFSGGVQRLTTWPTDVTSGGHTWTGLGSLLSVDAVGESEDADAQQITLGLSLVSTAQLAAVMGDASTYRGRAVRLRLQLFDDTLAPVGMPVLRWSGYMQPVRVVRQRPAEGEGGVSGRIELPCTRAGLSRARNYQGLRLTHAQQQARYSGDVGLQYLQGLIEQPALWLSKRFQEI